MEFNALVFFPEPPDEMGLWPRGVVGPLLVIGDHAVGQERVDGR